MSKSKKVITRLEDLAEKLLMAEASDLTLLAEIHTGFEGLVKWSERKKIKDAVAGSLALLTDIMLADAEDPAHALQVVTAGLESMISIERDNCSVSEAAFPAELLPGSSSEDKVNADQVLPSLSSVVDDGMLAEFTAKQQSVIPALEELVMDLEKSHDEGKLSDFKGMIHTLKGESALMGLSDVEQICHKIEDSLSGKYPEGLSDAFLKALDWLELRVNSLSDKSSVPGSFAVIMQGLDISAEADKPKQQTKVVELKPAEGTDKTDVEEKYKDLKLIINPSEVDMSLLSEFLVEAGEHLESADANLLTLESNPEDKEAINAVFRTFHTIKGVAGFLGLEAVNSLSHETENLLDKIRKDELRLNPAIMDVIFDCTDGLKKLREQTGEFIATSEITKVDQGLPGLIGRVQAVIEGRIEYAAPASVYQEAAAEYGTDTTIMKKASAGAAVKETVRVDADRLDRMVDAIGEMVIAETMLAQSISSGTESAAVIQRQLGLLDKITRELQETGTSLRMVPIKATFQKMARLVRDLSRKSGKNVNFTMSGEDTELDKSVVEAIGDPLVHMVRNSVDHGIEADPQDRTRIGKSEQGNVELRAFHKGGSIYIEIQDDGKGLNRDAILKKALERGLIKDDETLADREVWDLIFQPGFSTAAKVTDVSGRGVGMDVVRRSIETLRGNIEIQSEEGKGSTVSLRLPLTLAIIDGMVIRVGDERYIIPTLNIVRTLNPEGKDISTVAGRGEMLTSQESLIPIIRLGKVFENNESETELTSSLIIIVENNQKQVGLAVDELLGQQQTVIKSLGEGIKQIDGISGGAVMPDGRVGLILDVEGLVKLADRPLASEQITVSSEQ
ncbi:MAG: Hpt domain-containing protein [Planctomycetota bacterium]